MSAQGSINGKNTSIYQVFCGRWESANVIDHKGQVFKNLEQLPFENLKKHHIDTIYLLGVFDNRGPIVVNTEDNQDITNTPNRVPSIFSISDHTQTNPDLGTPSDLQALIKSLQAKEFKVIIDFVPNHTSTNHPWVSNHPDYYVKKNDLHITEFSGDVYKLDYQNQALQTEMMGILASIASWGVDGVRCDMAHLIPDSFWQKSIPNLRAQHPNFILYAEAYSQDPMSTEIIERFIKLGFDGVYHQALYENFKKVYSLSQPQKYLSDHIEFTKSRPDISAKLINYLANHDDPPTSMKAEEIKEMKSIIENLSGITFWYNGVIRGLTRRLAHHWVDILPDSQNELFDSVQKNDSSIPNNHGVIVLDIGASKVEAAFVDDQFIVNDSHREPTNKTSYEDFVAQINSTIDSYFTKYPFTTAISIALPGVIDQSGIVVFAGGSLPFLNQKNLLNDLKNTHSLPIYLENDSNCFALGEALWGAGKNYQTVLGITWGTGVGGGVVIDKKLFKGSGAAGEIGHIPVAVSKQTGVCGCGKSNCLEIYASGSAIQNQYKELGGKITSATAADIVNSDENIAVALIDQAVIFMADAIVSAINLLDPDIIVLGGGLSQIKDPIFEKLKKMVSDLEISSIQHTSIVKHQLPNAALVGAAFIPSMRK